jgi:hypothetical protein
MGKVRTLCAGVFVDASVAQFGCSSGDWCGYKLVWVGWQWVLHAPVCTWVV